MLGSLEFLVMHLLIKFTSTFRNEVFCSFNRNNKSTVLDYHSQMSVLYEEGEVLSGISFNSNKVYVDRFTLETMDGKLGGNNKQKY